MLVMSSTMLIVLVAAGMVLGTATLGSSTEPTTSTPRSRLCTWDKLIYAGFLASLAILALTGLGTMLTGRSPMSRWGLMLHATAAPGFAICTTLLALIWADRSRPNCMSSPFAFFQRTTFWLLIIAALVSILSAVLPMTPILGTAGQHLFHETHRYSSLVLFILVVVHGLGFLVARK